MTLLVGMMDSHESAVNEKIPPKLGGIKSLVVVPIVVALVCVMGTQFPDPINRYSMAVILGLGFYSLVAVLACPFSLILVKEFETLRRRVHAFDLTLLFAGIGVLSFVGWFLPSPINLLCVSITIVIIFIQMGTIGLYVLVRILWPIIFGY